MFHRILDVHPLTSTGSGMILIGSAAQILPAIAVGAVFALAGLVADWLMLRRIDRHHKNHREQLENLFALHERLAHPHVAAPVAETGPPDDDDTRGNR